MKYQDMKQERVKKASQHKKQYPELKQLHVNAFIGEIIEKTYA